MGPITMIAMPDVDALLDGGLQDWLNSKTAERDAARKRMYLVGGIAVAIAAILGLAAIASGWGTMGYVAAVIIGGAGIAWASQIRQAMVDSLKSEMNGALARALNIEYSVAAVRGAECDLAEEFSIMPSYDDDYYQDLWRGRIGETDFTLYEVKLTEERGSGKNRHTVTVFQGIILRLAFARGFLGTTVVRRDRMIKFTLFGDTMSGGGRKLERIKMVSPDFEDIFDVYGSDPVEARYLVHPEYCERLIALESSFDGEKIAALFHGGDLIVTIHCEDLFESASLNPDEDRARLAKTIGQFAEITRLVTRLNERPRG
jgi:hypothetical protein